MTLYGPKGAAARIGLSTSRLAQLDKAGILPAIHDDAGRRVWLREVVDRFAEEREAKRASAAQAASAA